MSTVGSAVPTATTKPTRAACCANPAASGRGYRGLAATAARKLCALRSRDRPEVIPAGFVPSLSTRRISGVLLPLLGHPVLPVTVSPRRRDIGRRLPPPPPHRLLQSLHARRCGAGAVPVHRTGARRFAWLQDDTDRARGMRSAEVRRMLDRARIKGGVKRIPADLQGLITERAWAPSLKELTDTLIIARWLSARSAGDVGERA